MGVDEAIRIHACVLNVDYAEALEHVRDYGLLESAILRPQNLFHYQQSAELSALAATLLFGLVNNHPPDQVEEWIRHNLEPLPRSS